jgi:hypothetical protein
VAVRLDFEGGPFLPGVRDDGAEGQPLEALTREGLFPHGQRIDRAILVFMALGVLLRVGHYWTHYQGLLLAAHVGRQGPTKLEAPLTIRIIRFPAWPSARWNSYGTVRISTV